MRMAVQLAKYNKRSILLPTVATKNLDWFQIKKTRGYKYPFSKTSGASPGEARPYEQVTLHK